MLGMLVSSVHFHIIFLENCFIQNQNTLLIMTRFHEYPKIQGLNFFAKPWKYIHIFYMLLTQTTGFRIYGWPKWFSTRIRRLSSVESEQGPDLVIVLTLTCQEILEWHVILEISSEISTIIKTKINSMRVAKKNL